ncbi:25S rRNA adenine-N(1) methyltransferase [Leucoagaricus sp. SymC.cos]|nr:25S rRNA adenine-N(1) methyltransferase [Leucoagaricus sp. SymC.cos]
MAKGKRRKTPISQASTSHPSSSRPQASRNVIRKFHVLIKSQKQLNSKQSLTASENEELMKINKEIDDLGGLEWYQRMSIVGQGNDRGGGSEKIFIGWLTDLEVHKVRQEPLQLLEVGALKPDNYRSCTTWIKNTPIDLRSQHPDIQEQDFLLLDPVQHENKWDVVSLSLVVNFVPDSRDREQFEGRMLRLANVIIKDNGFLFLALPLPCLANSRYMSFEHLNRLMGALGFLELKRRWKEGGKMAYWLYQKQRKPQTQDFEPFTKKIILRNGNRNNFNILLPRRYSPLH